LANDPDADRLAAATRTGDGQLVQLTGNELGLLLADFTLRQAPSDGRNLVLCSLVSSPLLDHIASARGARCEQTLTGFKWIANRAIELAANEGLRFVFGFEEALGYTAGTLVRDKDGVSCAALTARMAMHHARHGRSLVDALEGLYRVHGLSVSQPVSITLPGAQGMSKMQDVMERLRAAPPMQLGGLAVLGHIDLERGTETRGTECHPARLPKNNTLLFEVESGHRIAIRPSGTEPKIKIYIDAYTQVAPNEALSVARARASAAAEALRRAFLAQAGL
jgi:phosphomannomutase